MAQANRAVVINLHYDPEKSKEGRTEHSVVYVSFDWGELFEILKDPEEFFRKKRNKFNPQLNDRTKRKIQPFTLRKDTTIVVDSLRTNIPQGQKLLKLVNSDQPLSIKREFYRGQIKDLFGDGGGFIAEFAVETGILSILYERPDKRRIWDAPQTTPVTLARVAGTGLAHLHFDLIPAGENITPDEFATFCMKYIEDPDGVLSSISQDQIMKTDAGLVPEGDELYHDDPKELVAGEHVTLKFYSGTEEDPVDPSLVVDGALYQGPMGPPCYVWTCYIDTNGDWQCAWVKVKEY